MEIEYDPQKNRANIEERGLSFDDVVYLDWDHAYIAQDRRKDYAETRYTALALLDNRLHVVCFTWRDTRLRVISFRKANQREEACYAQKIAHR